MALIWHGGNRWEGPPEIRPAKRGRAEWGPGIYGTSNYFRAKDYAKGGKVTHLVEFLPERWMGNTALSLDVVKEFVRSNAPRTKALDILEVLGGSASRIRAERFDLLGGGEQFVPATHLLNMWVNTDLSSGARGPLLAKFFTEQGIDAHTERHGTANGEDEFWTVVFNPDCIRHHEIIAAKDVQKDLWSLGNPLEQSLESTHKPIRPRGI